METMSWDPLDAHVESLALAVDDGGLLQATLAPIGQAIKLAGERASLAAAEAPEEDVDFFVDEETALIENLLGAAYVTCQARISDVISRAIQVAEFCKTKTVTFTAPFAAAKKAGDMKVALLALGTPVASVAGITSVQAVDALANYFKHREEWPEKVDWSQAAGQQAKTVSVIAPLGLAPLSTGNLRSGAVALGFTDLWQVDALVSAVDQWANRVLAEVQTALPKKAAKQA